MAGSSTRVVREPERLRELPGPRKDPQQPRRVLLADGEEGFCRAATELLRPGGFLCDWVHDATEAVHAVERSRYDAVVADINMEGNHQLELVREIRQRFADLPVIIVTAHPTVATAIQALRLAAVDYMPKPVNFAELLERMDEAIRVRRQRRLIERRLREVGPVVRKLQAILESLAGAASVRGASAPALLRSATTRLAGIFAAEPGETPWPALIDVLSPREREILEAVASGQRVDAIARAFSISQFTVRNHLKAIFRKLGVHSQVELLAQLHGRSRPNHRGQESA
jgi:DNA-binding NarL/FixJ family response regulator